MHRIDGPGAVGGEFQEGNPQAGQRATKVTAEWANDLQGNMAAVIEGAGMALAKGDYSQLFDAIQALIVAGSPPPPASATPPGMIVAFASNSAKAGYLYCNGGEFNRAANAALFTEIGTTYGPGNGTTTANLPDYRGEFLRGLDDGRGVDPGRAVGSNQADAFKDHYHTANLAGGSPGAGTMFARQASGPFATGATVGSPEGSTETRPRNMPVYYFIKT